MRENTAVSKRSLKQSRRSASYLRFQYLDVENSAETEKAAQRPPFPDSISASEPCGLFCCRLGSGGCFFSGLCLGCLFGGLGFCCFGCCLLGGQSLGCGDLLGFDAGLLFSNGSALGVVQLAGADAGVFNDTSRLAATIAQVVQLGATDLTAANDVDAFDQRRVNREYALDAFAVGDLANGEALVDAAARTSDADAFIGLHAGTGTFCHAHVDAERVTCGKFRKGTLGFDLGGLFGFQLLDDVHRFNLAFFSNSQSARVSFGNASGQVSSSEERRRMHYSLLTVAGRNPSRCGLYTGITDLSPLHRRDSG